MVKRVHSWAQRPRAPDSHSSRLALLYLITRTFHTELQFPAFQSQSSEQQGLKTALFQILHYYLLIFIPHYVAYACLLSVFVLKKCTSGWMTHFTADQMYQRVQIK